MARKKDPLNDVANERPEAQIPIDRVGVKGVRLPVRVLDREREHQDTIATVDMFVDLPAHFRGTHMSRFVEILHLFRPEISLKRIAEVLQQMKEHLNAASSHLEVAFPYFIEKKAPVTHSPGLMDYACSFKGSSDPSGRIDLVVEVAVPITSVCPCSKEISEYGAHNQRGEVRVRTRFKKFIWIEDVIALVE